MAAAERGHQVLLGASNLTLDLIRQKKLKRLMKNVAGYLFLKIRNEELL